MFNISLSTINKWNQKYRKTGELKDKVVKRKFKKIDVEKLKVYIKDNPDAYLKEIGEEFDCSAMAVHKAFKRLKITQKKSMRYSEQDAEKAREYHEQINNIPMEKIAYVDETEINTVLCKEHR